MAAHPYLETALAARHAQPMFVDCKACGKLTLQTGKRACEDRNQCGGMVVNLYNIAETECGAVAVKLVK
ncbi:MAG TPA: hypothetical protein VF663_17370 [Telluria sp.]